MSAGAVDLALSCPAPTRRGRARTRGGRACWFAQEQEQQTLSLGGWYQSDSSSICLSLAHCTEPGSVLFQAELWFRGLMSRRRSVACYRPRRKRSRRGSADANGAQRAGDVHATTRCWLLGGAVCLYFLSVRHHKPPTPTAPAQVRCPRLGLGRCAPCTAKNGQVQYESALEGPVPAPGKRLRRALHRPSAPAARRPLFRYSWGRGVP